MSRAPSHHRVTTSSRFGPSLEWEELAILGGDRTFRARFWRRVALPGLALFWGGVIALALWAVG